MNEIERDFRTQSQHLLWSVWRGLLVGVTAGAVVSLFRWLIAKGAAFSVAIYEDALRNPLLILGIVLVNLLIALFIGYLIKQEKDIKGSGIPHVEGELMGLLHPSWWSVLWRKFLGGVLGISMGLMLGREGPSIQLGAMTAKGLAEGLKLSAREKRARLKKRASIPLPYISSELAVAFMLPKPITDSTPMSSIAPVTTKSALPRAILSTPSSRETAAVAQAETG